MKNTFLLLFTLITAYSTSAQTTGHSTIEKQKVYRYVDPMPKASYDLNKYFLDNMQYSDEAIVNKEKGRILVDFVMQANGDAANITVRNSFRYPNLAKEAIRLIDDMPLWQPGKKDGKAVNVALTQAIIFNP